MKQNRSNSLSIETGGKEKQNIAVLCLTALLLLAGFFDVLFQTWKLEEAGASLIPVLLVSVCISCVLIIVKEKTAWYGILLAALVAVPALLVPVFRKGIAGSLGTLLNQAGQWRFLQTGWFVKEFEANGNLWPVLLLLAVLAGILVQVLVQSMRGQLVILPAAAWLLLLVKGSLNFSYSGLFLLAGCALALVSGFSGNLKSWLWTLAVSVLTGAIALGLVLLFRIQGPEGTLGRILQESMHKARYESSEVSMPEGRLEDLGAFSQSEDAALEVSMTNWKTLYLRGFQGGVYTGNSWESLPPEALEEEKELLASLQKSGFYASSQIAEGWKSLGEAAENTITVTNTGACKAYQYLPYAADTAGQLDPLNIQGEGTAKKTRDTATYSTYNLEDSYLLMEALSEANDKGLSQEYLEKEKAYRDFVYDQYLDIPEQTATLLKIHSLEGQKGISTAQACREVRILLKETIKTNEAAVFYNHSGDFLEYLLNVSPNGYSVHYATLATMMLRSYGIPARYVEGYYLPAKDSKELKSGDSMQLTQKNAAAWVEYYVDGVGWLAFDPNPGHTQIVEYEFPVGEGDSDVKVGNIGFSTQKQKEKDQDSEEDEEIKKTSSGKSPGLKAPIIVLIIVAVLLLLALLAAVIRTLILRDRMRKQRAKFTDPDPGVATSAIICSLRKLVCQSLKLPESAFFENPEEMVTTLLEMENQELMEWKGVCDRIQFSPHPIPEETRVHAKDWLDRTEASWKAGVSLPRRILHKFILCDVY